MEDIVENLFDLLFLLPESEVEGLPYEVENLVEIRVLLHLFGIDGTILLHLYLDAIQNSLQRRVPRL
jgi:hypothetical protein